MKYSYFSIFIQILILVYCLLASVNKFLRLDCLPCDSNYELTNKIVYKSLWHFTIVTSKQLIISCRQFYDITIKLVTGIKYLHLYLGFNPNPPTSNLLFFFSIFIQIIILAYHLLALSVDLWDFPVYHKPLQPRLELKTLCSFFPFSRWWVWRARRWRKEWCPDSERIHHCPSWWKFCLVKKKKKKSKIKCCNL